MSREVRTNQTRRVGEEPPSAVTWLEDLRKRVEDRLAKMTPEERAAEERAERERLEAREEDRWRRKCDHYGVPLILRGARLDGEEDFAVKTVREYLAADFEQGRALVLAGRTGVGKTWSALAACRHLHGERAWAFWFFPAWCGRVLDPARREGAMANALDAEFLVLDDFGAEYQKAGGFLEAKVDELFWHREGHRLATLITTNLTPEEFAKRVSDRIVDRLRGWGKVVQVVGSSRRKGNRCAAAAPPKSPPSVTRCG